MKWKVKSFNDLGYDGHYTLPANRKDSHVRVGGTFTVCLLAQGACKCVLEEAFKNNEIHIPSDIGSVHLWSDSDWEAVETPNETQFRESMLKQYHCIDPKKLSKAKVRLFLIILKF
jgi:hypothetical protein